MAANKDIPAADISSHKKGLFKERDLDIILLAGAESSLSIPALLKLA